MKNYSYSYQPDGKYFVFDLDTGETIRKDIEGNQAARQQWIILRGMSYEKRHHS